MYARLQIRSMACSSACSVDADKSKRGSNGQFKNCDEQSNLLLFSKRKNFNNYDMHYLFILLLSSFTA